jgi:translation initiation factor IF-3
VGSGQNGFSWRVLAIERRQQRVNEQIRTASVRVIAEDGQQLGIISTVDALAKAHGANLDLVEVAPLEDPPVCKIMDYGKFKYQQKKRQQKGHGHHGKNKEIRLRPKIGKHDFDFKINRAREFLKQKDKVIFSVVFRGRENAHVDEGFKLVDNLIRQLDDVAKIEQNAAMQGRRIVVILAPK